MNYTDAITYLEEKNSLGILPGLENVLGLLHELGDPQKAVPAIHIAGTNGKGTIMSFVEQVLIRCGLKVGRFISPALKDIREMWTINGEMISREETARILTRVREAEERTGIRATVFETETAAAFLLFREQGCDLQLVECGMGGRQDATNVLPGKILNILASVSMDHMQFLGDTREKILIEKLGILGPGEPLVTSPMDGELREALRRELEHKENTRVTETDLSRAEQVEMHPEGTSFRIDGRDLRIRMAGDVALENALTAYTALQEYDQRAAEFGLPGLKEDALREGFLQVEWPGRFTLLRESPTVILDGAHNRDAWLRLRDSVKKLYPGRRVLLVTGVLRDKEVDCLVDTFAPLADRVYTFTPDSPRALGGEELARRFSQAMVGKITETESEPDQKKEKASKAAFIPDPFAALEAALTAAAPEDVVLACGSLTFISSLLDRRKEIEMFRVTRILQDPDYRQHMKMILSKEYDREFCRHGLGHGVAVARIAWILSQEEGLQLPKEILYAAALLHDVGRYTPLEETMSHHEAGAVVAVEYLKKAGFSEEERQSICNAIRNHKHPGPDGDKLSDVLYRADKLSRSCFMCDSREDCYWPEDRKNRTLLF